MYHRIRSIAGAVASVSLILVVAACSDAPLPTAQGGPGVALAKGGVQKFTFEDVALDDGTLVVKNAVIEAGVRDHRKDKNDWTNCSYFTEGWGEHLGQFGAEGVPPGFGDGEHDAGDVRDFCMERFADRQ